MNEKHVALLYGQAGSGKTVNSVRVPGKTLLLSSDFSAVVLKQFPDCKADVEEVVHWVDKDASGKPQKCFREQFEKAVDSKMYDNIVIDNLTDLFDLAVLEYDESGHYADPRKYYLIIYQQIRRLVRYANSCGCNVIFTAWEETDQVPLSSGEVVARIRPKLSMKILDSVLGLCQVIGHVEHAKDKTGKERWYYSYNGSQQMYAKDQLYLRKSGLPENLFKGEEKK